MNEQDYERLVNRLEQRHDNQLLALAVAEVERAEKNGCDVATDEAKEAVERWLFSHPEWERVEAVDISDIAYEYANKAWAQVRAWESV